MRESVDESRRGRVVGGIVLIVLGVLWLAERLDWVALRPAVVLPAAVALIGVAAVVASFDGPHPGLVVAGSILAVITVAAAAVPGIGGGIGDRRYTPRTPTEVESPYRLGVGSLTVDLTGLDVAGTVQVVADVGVGELVVVVPPDAALAVTGEAVAGAVTILGDAAEGLAVEKSYSSGGGERGVIVLDLGVTLGEVEVRS